MFLLISLCALFVYYDATKNKIGKISGEEGFTNISAGGWATCVLLLWIVAFPLYLFKRRALIDKASQRPVEAKARAVVLGLFSVICVVLLLATIAPHG